MTTHCHQFDLEIEIAASCAKVWNAIFEETNTWWLPDFHVAGPNSTVTFDSQPGGRGIYEEAPDGTALQWFVVQMIVPREFKVYLVGNVAPEWGGPTTSNLKLALVEKGGGCVLRVSDARYGNIDEAHVESSKDGWKALFTDGLKAFVEKETPQ